jgi:hypothetical protein
MIPSSEKKLFGQWDFFAYAPLGILCTTLLVGLPDMLMASG